MKKLGVWAFFIILALSLVPLVSAGPFDKVSSELDNFVSGIRPFVQLVLGNISEGQDSGDLLFAKVLFFIVIFTLVWVAVNAIDMLSEHDWVVWTLTTAVAILATRWISVAFIQAILLPYSALGIALSAGLPVILAFFLIEKGLSGYKRLRRLCWAFIALIFVGLWISRYDVTSAAGLTYVYPLTAVFALLMALFDGTIQRFFLGMRLDKTGKASTVEAIAHLRDKISKLPDMVLNGSITQKESDKLKAEYQKKIIYFHKF